MVRVIGRFENMRVPEIQIPLYVDENEVTCFTFEITKRFALSKQYEFSNSSGTFFSVGYRLIASRDQ